MTLFDRARAALADDYDVREEIGRGGMGAVFRAVDLGLDRPVAIKVLLPELASARAVERFVREARALARLEHPGVIRVHHAGEAGGLYYYVMDLISGETLGERLARGPLEPAALDRLADDLLEALAALHDAGIVHRDVKPSNIFLVEDRAILGDFGIVRLPGAGRTLTRADESVGTPGYWAPEQQWGGEATPASDVYAAGLVLYESCTGHSWSEAAASASPWARVPRRLRTPLRKALQPDPDDRWQDAAELRAALQVRSPFPGVAAAVLAVAAVLVLSIVLGGSDRSSPEVGDLAVLPFEAPAAGPGTGTGEPCDPGDDLGCRLAHLVAYNLEDLPDLKVVPAALATRIGAGEADATPPWVRSTFYARGLLVPRTDRMELRLIVEDSVGERLPERTVTGRLDDPWSMADSIAMELVWAVQPRLASAYRGLEERTTSSFPALREFLLGEHAFQRNAWSSAERHYRQALANDSAFAVAEWRLWNVWRWKLTGEEVVDLEELYRTHGSDLGTVDRALLAAVAQGPGAVRIRGLEAAAEAHGHAAYARLLLADELYHRGPLVGRSLGEAAGQFAEAAALNPFLGPAYEHGLLALIRLGREADARDFLERLREVAAPPAPGEFLHFPTLVEQAFLERFEPERASARREQLFDVSRSGGWEAAAFAARMGLAVDAPRGQIELGRLLATAPAPSLQVDGHRARGLALLAMGRPVAALAAFDQAGAMDPEVALEAAEWRVLIPALDLTELPADEAERGRAHLRAMAGDSVLGGRAAWALAIDAFARGDTVEGRRRGRALRAGDGDGARLRRLAGAYEALASGAPESALRLSDPLLEHQFLPRGGDPFARAVVYLTRAAAFEALGQSARARAARVWSENQDIARVLGGSVQAVEVDWAVSPYSDRRRARLALARQDTAAGCRLLERVLYLWDQAEPRILRDLADDRRRHRESCP
ncbi:MAG: protein kinase [Longimicrobiales bacterium]|nr:protein kinase [Longimicrobiales bacterium]